MPGLIKRADPNDVVEDERTIFSDISRQGQCNSAKVGTSGLGLSGMLCKVRVDMGLVHVVLP